MMNYKDVFKRRPYIYHDGYPYVYVWRLLTPTGKESNHLCNTAYVKSKRKLSRDELVTKYPQRPPMTGYTWDGPYIYEEPTTEKE